MVYTLTTTPHRDAMVRTPATLDVLIRAKRARIEAIQGWATSQTVERERAELAKLEARS
jgi:hypothetical protein